MGKNIVPSVAGISDAGKIMNEIAFKGADVNLKDLANQIQTFLRNDGFSKVYIEADGYGNYFDVQGIKSGWWRTISSSRKAIHVIIEGAPNRFTVNVGVGEWGKNIGVASLTAISTMGIGLIFQGAGIGSNILFERKLNKFINSAVSKLKGNATLKFDIDNKIFFSKGHDIPAYPAKNFVRDTVRENRKEVKRQLNLKTKEFIRAMMGENVVIP